MAGARYEVSEDARQDLALQYAWYFREAGEGIAERYLDAFRGAVDLLGRQSGIGVQRRFRNPRLKGIRSFQLPAPFRVHLVFYCEESDGIVVFRVLHGMKDLPRRLLEPPGSAE